MLPDVMQMPPMEKQPVARLMPVPKVEVAVPIILSAEVWMPPLKVDVAKPETVRFVVDAVPKNAVPDTAMEVEDAKLMVCNCDQVLAVVVPKPKENAPVDELYASGYRAESDDEEILLLKLPQSVEAR